MTVIQPSDRPGQFPRECGIETILDALQEHVLYYDRDMHILWANSAARASANMSLEKLKASRCWHIWANRKTACRHCPVIRAMSTGTAQRAEKTNGDGRTWIVKGYPVKDDHGSVIGGIETSLEITDRKRAEDALSEAHGIISRSPAVAFIWKNDGGWPVKFVTPNVSRVFGYDADAFMSGHVCYESVVYPEDLERVTAEVIRYSAEQDRMEFVHEPYRIVSKDGSVRWISDQTSIDRNADGSVRYYKGIIEDITERVRADKALKESEERFRQLVDLSPQTICEIDANGMITYVNQVGLDTFGYSPSDIQQGLSALQVVVEKDRDRVRRNIGLTLQGRLRKGTEYTALRSNGSTFPIIAYSSRIMLEDTPVGLRCIIIDLTDLRQLEEQLRLAQKVEAIGQLAGGVAHDLNNMLTPILCYGEMLLSKFAPGDRRQAEIGAIYQAGLKAKDLVKQLLAFGRKQALEMKIVDLNEIITDFWKLLRRAVRENVRVNLALNPSISVIEADVGQMEQILLNLVVNAQDAMPDGGVISIQTDDVVLDENYVALHEVVQPGPYVMVTVSDTGTGMDAETRAKIFDPFFTTKESGRGTGLGLSTVYGIVKQHRGNIWVYSEPGGGTTFRLYFPIKEDRPRLQQPAPAPAVKVCGSETVMVVEDDLSVMEMLETVLSDYGFKVLSAASGPDCLELLKSGSAPVKLIITDVVMPGMNGKELHQVIAETHPHIRVIYMSGYTDDLISHHGILDPGVNFIQKPFSANSLASKIREVLDRKPNASTAVHRSA